MTLAMLIKQLRKERKLSQSDIANLFGIKYQAVQKWEKGENSIPGQYLQQLADTLGVSVSVLLCVPAPVKKNTSTLYAEVEQDGPFPFDDESVKAYIHSNARRIRRQTLVRLPYAPVPARASFIEMSDPAASYGRFETYPAYVEEGEDVRGQVIFEVNGDSMDPRYASGTKVRSKLVDPSQWPYLKSGVYAISYAESFVIKRVKDNEIIQKGFLTLHSDNTETGGSTPVPIEQLRHIWRVIRIVDAPAD